MEEAMRNALPENEGRLYLDWACPSYKLMRWLGLIRGEGFCIWMRIIYLIAVTWIPLFVLSALQGRALGPTPRESFLLDFATYARFLLALPLCIAAEPIVLPRLARAGLHFVRSGLVSNEDYPAFEEAVARMGKRAGAVWPEMVMLCFAVLGAWAIFQGFYASRTATWHVIAGLNGNRFSLAGLWYNFIAVPLLQFVMYRWLWRLIIWSSFLRSMSRLNLRLVSTHPDEAAGLGFLGGSHVTFGYLAMTLGSVLSAEAAFQMVFEGVEILSFKTIFATYLIVSELIFLGPLLIFTPLLLQKRQEGIRAYGALANRYNLLFQEKWVEGTPPKGEQLLGNPDIQSLADMGNSYQMIQDMRIIPLSVRTIMQMTALACIPWLPLLPLAIPVTEIMKLFVGALL